tara:strand:+ start:66 stop:554 length:489 start_codon:yes stop_codon:yes gene_type:complete
MNNRGGLALSLIIITVVLVIGIGIGVFYFSEVLSYEKPAPIPDNQDDESCAGQGESTDFTDPSKPNECCEGLTNVATSDSVSIEDKCYWSGTESGIWWAICSDCGNGICEDSESVCGCSEDCIDQGKSDYETIEDFCEVANDKYRCDRESLQDFLEICQLCN